MTKHLVVMVTYNYAAYVEQAIACLRAQTESDWRCTIVDNGSTDGTARVAMEGVAGDPRFQVIQKANEGPSAGRNLGFRQSERTEYVTFLDGDDLLAPTFLERLGGHLDAHPECGIVTCQFDRMTSAGEHMDGGFRSRFAPGPLLDTAADEALGNRHALRHLLREHRGRAISRSSARRCSRARRCTRKASGPTRTPTSSAR